MRSIAIGEVKATETNAVSNLYVPHTPQLDDLVELEDGTFMDRKSWQAWKDSFKSGRSDRLYPQEKKKLNEKAVMVCPQCEGEGFYADGLDEAACSTECTRCGSNGWIVDLANL